MYSYNECACVDMKSIERSFYYRGTEVLNMEIEYPSVSGTGSGRTDRMINNRIKGQVNTFYDYVRNQLYRDAVDEYHTAMENNFPFREFSAVLAYNVTYNKNCHLSMFRDQFQYTSGAHGSTIKMSDTWNIRTGRLVPMADYFRPGADYKCIILNEAIKQANKDPSIYFENYAQLMNQYFNPESYYLSDDGLVIYYQEYEIAPYTSGLPTFTIPYSLLDYPPTCYRFM